MLHFNSIARRERMLPGSSREAPAGCGKWVAKRTTCVEVRNISESTRRKGCEVLAKPLLVTGSWHPASHLHWAKPPISWYQTWARAIHRVHLNQISSLHLKG